MIRNWAAIALGIAVVPVLYMFVYAATLSIRLKKKYLQSGCVGCGYDLTSNTTGACPECGHPIPFKQKRYLKRQ